MAKRVEPQYSPIKGRGKFKVSLHKCTLTNESSHKDVLAAIELHPLNALAIDRYFSLTLTAKDHDEEPKLEQATETPTGESDATADGAAVE